MVMFVESRIDTQNRTIEKYPAQTYVTCKQTARKLLTY